MSEEIARSYRRAREVTSLGAGCMYALLLLALFNAFAIAYVAVGTDALAALPPAHVAIMLVSNFVPALQILPLAGFLRRFGSDSPFAAAQSIRLVTSGALLLLHEVLVGMYDPVGAVSVPSSLASVQVTDAPGIEVSDVTMVVFLFCLALVVRYGGALKEDSDSIA